MIGTSVFVSPVPDLYAVPSRQVEERLAELRAFLESLFRLPERLLQVGDDATIVCRCEEVSAGQIRAAAADGHLDSNQVKFLTRCGMGPCQGRQCADAVAQVLAAELGGRRREPVVGGRVVRLAAQAVGVVAANVEMPAGYSLVWSGQYEYMVRAKNRLLIDMTGAEDGMFFDVPDWLKPVSKNRLIFYYMTLVTVVAV